MAARLASCAGQWAVAGGWAIELHLGEPTRPHDDLEIVTAGDHLGELHACLSELDWFAVGDGRAWPIAVAPGELHQTWGRDSAGRWRLDAMREPWDGDEWVFRRDPRIRRALADAIEIDPRGIPYLAPELVLLFKARARRTKDDADFGMTLPALTVEGTEWLRRALLTAHPGHEWISRLTSRR